MARYPKCPLEIPSPAQASCHRGPLQAITALSITVLANSGALLAGAVAASVAFSGIARADTPVPHLPKIVEHGNGTPVPGDRRDCAKMSKSANVKAVWYSACMPTDRTATGGEWRLYEVSNFVCTRADGTTFNQARITASVSTGKPCGKKHYDDTKKMFHILNGNQPVPHFGGIYPPPRREVADGTKPGKVANPRKPKGDKRAGGKAPVKTAGRTPPSGWDWVRYDAQGNPTYGMPDGKEITYNRDGGTTIRIPAGSKDKKSGGVIRLSDGPSALPSAPSAAPAKAGGGKNAVPQKLPKAPPLEQHNRETLPRSAQPGTSAKNVAPQKMRKQGKSRRTSARSARVRRHRSYRKARSSRVRRLRHAGHRRRAARRHVRGGWRTYRLPPRTSRVRTGYRSEPDYRARRRGNAALRAIIGVGIGMAINHGMSRSFGHRGRGYRMRSHRAHRAME